MTNLVRISKAEEAGLPLKPSTLYKWFHTRKHPEIFVKLGGAVFVDTIKLGELIEKCRGT